jgi:hypothetical protein
MSKKNTKIFAGGKVICKNKEAVLGAIIKYKDKNCILIVYHLLKVGGCGLGDLVEVDGCSGTVIKILIDLDLAIIEVEAPESELEFSRIRKPEIGSAYALNGSQKNPCQIMTIGRTYHYLSFPFSTIPLPGDSGSPIIQKGNVVGILASVFYSNANGIAVSLEPFY